MRAPYSGPPEDPAPSSSVHIPTTGPADRPVDCGRLGTIRAMQTSLDQVRGRDVDLLAKGAAREVPSYALRIVLCRWRAVSSPVLPSFRGV
jgi:hypothetical protein